MLTKFIPYVRLAPAALIGVLALIAVIQWAEARHWQKRYVGEAKAHSATIARYEGAQRVAVELNKAKVERIERERRDVANVKDTEIRRGIDAAVADAQRVWRERTAKSLAGGSTASETSTAPIDTSGAGGVPIMDASDVRICTINTMKAKGWQDFYGSLDAPE